MPRVAYVPFTGFRIREEEMLALGMSLPGLRQRAAAIAGLPALGVLTLAGMTPPHWECSYHEAARADDAIADRIAAERPTLVALSALTASVEEAYRFSAMLRSRGTRTVLGGLHATACPDEARLHCVAVVVGDGEPVWRDVLADAETDSLQPVYKAKAPFDLQQAPLPRFDLLGERTRPRFTVQTQRGCPFACEFCGASRLLGPYRLKPVQRIRDELDAIAARNPRPLIELADDNTFAGNRHPGALFEALDAVDARYFTEADWRIGEQPDVLAGLAASGCVQVLVGLESLVFRHPGMGQKEAELSRIMDALSAIQEAGVAVIGCFIVGCDGETRQSIEKLARFLDDCLLADVQLTVQTPFPGTALHRRLYREGRLLPDRGWSSHTLFDVTYRPDSMTVEELETAFRELVCSVFSPQPAMRRTSIRRTVWHNHPKLRPCASEPCSFT